MEAHKNMGKCTAANTKIKIHLIKMAARRQSLRQHFSHMSKSENQNTITSDKPFLSTRVPPDPKELAVCLLYIITGQAGLRNVSSVVVEVLPKA